MTSATNERQIAAARARAKADAQTDKIVTQSLMSNPSGRRWVWLQLSFAEIYSEDQSLDHAQMAYAKGRRNSGLKLLQSVNRHAPKHYIQMLEENSGVVLTEDKDETDD